MKRTFHKYGFLIYSLFVFFVSKAICLLFPVQTSAVDSDFGTINPPPGVDKYNQEAEIGIIIFISNMIRLATIVAGIWTLINFVLAGWIYLTNSDDADAGSKVSQKMINTVIGLVIVVLAYSIAGLVGLLVFGDASFILNPELTTADDL